MEDLNELLRLSETYPMRLSQMSEEFLVKLRVILWGQAALPAVVPAGNKEKGLKDLSAASPQQTNKRVKRLSSLSEDNEAEAEGKLPNFTNEILAPVAAPRANTTSAIDEKEVTTVTGERKSEGKNLMPPPPVPTAITADETLNKRPQRAAKLKSEKNLKEPKLGTKLRRPTSDEIKIKLESEQRPSQMHEQKANAIVNASKHSAAANETSDLSSQTFNDSVVAIIGKKPSIVSISSDTDDVQQTKANNENISMETLKEKKKSTDSSENEVRGLRIKIKREKVSLERPVTETPSEDVLLKAPNALPLPIPLTKNDTKIMEESSVANSILSSTTNTTTAPAKKARKKKDVVHKPIKVERFSDLESKHAPISSRTRNGSLSKTESNTTPPIVENNRPASIYEDAVENPLSRNSKELNNATVTTGIANETVTLGSAVNATMNCTYPAQTTFQVAAPGQTTFVVDSNHNATVTLNKHSGAEALADATFDVNQMQKAVKDEDAIGNRSFETAKDSSVPHTNSLLTEDDSSDQEKPIVTKKKVASTSGKTTVASTKSAISAKAGYKMPTRTNELFNPSAQSPVKMRVEAFENAAAAAATEHTKRPLRNKKENLTPTSVTTPIIGKLQAPALGRFLTPTQGSNITTSSSTIAKKGTTSASKALPMPKSASASSLHRSNSTTTTKTLQRENSADDFRKDLHSLAEERKKLREQKHILAAQQREAKERERAERMAKLAKEREEKRLLKKKQDQEQKKRELEEIQRKLRQQQEDDAAKVKAAKEREMLLQMKQQQQLAKQKMMPPPPKTTSKYTFEMLHEDDSTDDEDKVSYKRPPPPSWSRSHVRGPNMLKQEYAPATYIDSLFSVQPMTPDLKIIFPNIDARHLKRNSSVLWSTPPRYSELPKY